MNGYFLIYVFNIGFNDLWCFSLYKKIKQQHFLQKKSHFTFMEIFSVRLESVQENLLKLSNRDVPSLPALSLRCACKPRRGRREGLNQNIAAHSET